MIDLIYSILNMLEKYGIKHGYWSFCQGCGINPLEAVQVPHFFKYCPSCGFENRNFDENCKNWKLGFDGSRQKFCVEEKHGELKGCIAEDRRKAESWWGKLIGYQENDFNYCPICGLFLKY